MECKSDVEEMPAWELNVPNSGDAPFSLSYMIQPCISQWFLIYPLLFTRRMPRAEDHLSNLVNGSQGISRHPANLLFNIPNPGQGENNNYCKYDKSTNAIKKPKHKNPGGLYACC